MVKKVNDYRTLASFVQVLHLQQTNVVILFNKRQVLKMTTLKIIVNVETSKRATLV